jgi:hypothetical protein
MRIILLFIFRLPHDKAVCVASSRASGTDDCSTLLYCISNNSKTSLHQILPCGIPNSIVPHIFVVCLAIALSTGMFGRLEWTECNYWRLDMHARCPKRGMKHNSLRHPCRAKAQTAITRDRRPLPSMNGWITTMLRACAAWVSMVLKAQSERGWNSSSLRELRQL